jgi:hypothetical protein
LPQVLRDQHSTISTITASEGNKQNMNKETSAQIANLHTSAPQKRQQVVQYVQALPSCTSSSQHTMHHAAGLSIYA